MASVSEKFNNTFSKVTSNGFVLFFVMAVQFTFIFAVVCTAMDYVNEDPNITVAIICGTGAGWMVHLFMRNLYEIRKS